MLLGPRALAAALQLQLLGYKTASHIENTKKPGLPGFSLEKQIALALSGSVKS